MGSFNIQRPSLSLLLCAPLRVIVELEGVALWVNEARNLVVPERWPSVTASCTQQRLRAVQGLFRTWRAPSLWAVKDSCRPGAAEPGSGCVRQAPKEFVHAPLEVLHVEGRVSRVEGSHRDRGTENKRELLAKRCSPGSPGF